MAQYIFSQRKELHYMENAASTINVSPMQWGTLNDIDEVEPLNETDYECLRAIRQVLLKHNKIDRFGVSLLHKHFDVQDDEQLVEFCDSANRCLTIKPIKTAETMKSIGTMWKLTEDENKPIFECQVCSPVNNGHKAAPCANPKHTEEA